MQGGDLIQWAEGWFLAGFRVTVRQEESLGRVTVTAWGLESGDWTGRLSRIPVAQAGDGSRAEPGG